MTSNIPDLSALILLVPDKADPERDAVAAAWQVAGGRVLKLGRFWEPPELDQAHVRLYGNDTFCLVLAEKLSLHLVSPPDRILAKVPESLLRRRLRIVPLATVRDGDFPVFAKPVVPKQFKSAVYDSAEALAAETRGLEREVEVIVSEIVTFVAEARAFVLDGIVTACAIYEGSADCGEATQFAARVAGALDLPRTSVVDVGRLSDGTWALIECNATWGAGLNGCDASSVIACIAVASGAA
ncbi:MAG TPA: ATP-grasp domain-containing protein [Labilithrix sp.]|nr:ATP-grasp domain-containing protein [Labilithrix sp.]